MKPLRVQQIAGWEFNLSELLRIKSQILAEHDRESAMNCLTEVVAVARAQSALAWELRSTMDFWHACSAKTAGAIRPGMRWLSSTTASQRDLKPQI
jgi:hypothetical protein